ncbi:MAG TPA: hypothetical protein VNG33_24245 [Polyangiaceae bacterium]|nr:hypothetical protein [Polyangiaceae bacterium]
MNFFGHAALAASHFTGEAGEAFVPSPRELATLCAGAMLPDFIGMLRLTRPTLDDPMLARGVAFHHRTDEVFHDLPSFHRLSRQAFAWLSERQLPRGPARAVAHIGIEMLLDEVLAGEQRARDAYRAALEIPHGPLLRFPAPADAERLASLQRALLGRSATEQTPAAELVAERIVRTLSGRPRLATDEAGQRLLGGWVAVTRPLVAAEAPEVLAGLREQLANFGRAE